MEQQYNPNPQQPVEPSKGKSIAALVCGILGIVGSFIPIVCYFTLILAILGVVFGMQARKECGPNNSGLATAGFVLGIIGLCFAAIGVICAICAVAAVGSLGGLAALGM